MVKIKYCPFNPGGSDNFQILKKLQFDAENQDFKKPYLYHYRKKYVN